VPLLEPDRRLRGGRGDEADRERDRSCAPAWRGRVTGEREDPARLGDPPRSERDGGERNGDDECEQRRERREQDDAQ